MSYPEHEAPIPDTPPDPRPGTRFGDRGCSVESEDGEQSCIDSPLFFRCQVPGEVTESLPVHGTDLLDEDASGCAVDVYLGAERRWFGAGGCGRHQHDRPWEEDVGLHDDAEARATLFVANASGESQSEDVTPAHEGSP